VKVFAAVAAEGASTIWRKAKIKQPGFPQPTRRGERCTRFNVGEIRAYLAGGQGNAE
jgi:predicted DNA-binding transcriptional regulator AlpA